MKEEGAYGLRREVGEEEGIWVEERSRGKRRAYGWKIEVGEEEEEEEEKGIRVEERGVDGGGSTWNAFSPFRPNQSEHDIIRPALCWLRPFNRHAWT